MIAYLRILNVPMRLEKPALLSRVNSITIQIRDPFFGIIAKKIGSHYRIVDIDVKIELDFFPYPLFSIEFLKELGFRCTRIGTIDEIPSLRCLKLKSLYISADKGYFLPTNQLHRLTQLEHLFLYVCSDGLDLSHFPNLKSLGIKTSSFAVDGAFPEWIQNLTIQNAAVKFEARRESIVYLRLVNCRVDDVRFPEILPNLKRLSVVSSYFSRSDSLGIEELRELVFLEMDGTNVDEISLEDTSLMFIILKNLNWRYLPKLPEYLFALHLISLPNLRIPTWVRRHVSSSMALLVTNCQFE